MHSLKESFRCARNLLHNETVKALMQVKANFDVLCPEMYDLVLKNRTLLDNICGGDKYFN